MPARSRPLTRVVACLSLLAATLHASADGLPRAHAATPAAPTFTPSWLRIDPRDLASVYVGGSATCDSAPSGCSTWIFRSNDGGISWTSLRAALDTLDQGRCVQRIEPFSFDWSVATPYASVAESCGTPASGSNRVQRSEDGGLTWQALGHYGGTYGGGNFGLTIRLAMSAHDSTDLYAIAYPGGGSESIDVSLDDGATWRLAALPATNGGGPTLVTSLAVDQLGTPGLYANVYTPGVGADAADSGSTTVWRSLDQGASWTLVAPPATSPALRTFGVSFDVHLPDVLVGRTDDTTVPADRRYLSRDGGTTWQVGRCPGDHNGHCPAFIVDNAFEFGRSYALVDGGVYPFSGGGPASAQPMAGVRLPLSTADLRDVASSGGEGSPIYLLGSPDAAHPDGRLYLSTAGGASWLDLSGSLRDAIFPNLAAPSRAAGALPVAATRHSVAAPFVATYRRLGLRTIGYPVTEAYREGGVLTQVFEHLQLERRGTTVTVAPLGDEVLGMRLMQGQDRALSGYEYGEGAVAPLPSSAAVRYFPQTRHTLRGDLLRFWQQHGGMATLGAPLTEVITDTNGDGSGRSYQMQWFQNGRLERHPELHDPRYAILLGLVGRDALSTRGWT